MDTMTLEQALGAAIRSRRLSADLAQEDVIARSSIPRSTYLKIERGEASANVGQLQAIAAVLEVSASSLMAAAEAGEGQPVRARHPRASRRAVVSDSETPHKP